MFATSFGGQADYSCWTEIHRKMLFSCHAPIAIRSKPVAIKELYKRGFSPNEL